MSESCTTVLDLRVIPREVPVVTEPVLPTPTTEEAPPSGSVVSWSFLGLLMTQFLGAANDNIFRWLIVPIGKYIMGPEREAIPLAVGTAVFVIPFILFAAPAGYLADRFSKRSVIVGCKVAEVLLMLAAIAAVLYGNVWVMFVLLFLMGTHSALFSPSKYGAIPEVVRPQSLAAANGLVGMTTILAIVAGTILGGLLYTWTGPDGRANWWISASVLVGVAGAGLASSMLIGRLKPARPNREIPWNIASETYRDVAMLIGSRPLLAAALGSAMFWSLGCLVQLTVDQFVTRALQLSQDAVGPLLAVLAFGVGVGNVLAGVWSRGRIELGIVFFGAVGITAGNFLIAGVPDPHGSMWSAGYVAAAVGLFVLGCGAGMYDVPLQSYLQHHSPTASRGAILAAANFLTFSGTILASGIFWLLNGPLGLSARTIFFVAGLAMIGVVGTVLGVLPIATLRLVFRIWARCNYRLRLHGAMNLPAEGGALLVSNHVSWLDGLLIIAFAPRPVRMIALKEHVDRGFVGWLSRRTGVIPIQPGRPKSVIETLRTARAAIARGEIVGIFPEGGISRTGGLQAFQPGLLRIVPEGGHVVPLHIGGMWGSVFSFSGGKFFWKWPHWRRLAVDMRFGPPLSTRDGLPAVHEAVQQLAAADGSPAAHPTLPLPRRLLRCCRRNFFRAKVADTTGTDLTGGRLLTAALVMRRLLRQRVLDADERCVGLLVPPSVGAVVANAALALDRRVAINLNYTANAEILNECIRQAGIRRVLTSRRLMDRFPLKLDVPLVFLEDLKQWVGRWEKLRALLIAAACPAWLLERWLGLHRVRPDDLLTIIFTSGSTGQPKGVMLSQHNVASNLAAFERVLDLRPYDVILGVLPMFHSFGYTTTLWTALALDVKAAYHYSPLEADPIGQLCRQHRVTVMVCAPTFLRTYVRRCNAEDLTALEAVITGSERLPPTLRDEFHHRFRVRPVEGYGTTELSPVVSCNIPPGRARSELHSGCKDGTVGQPLPGIAAKVVHPESGQRLPADESGMLCITGPNVMLGYLNLPQQTADVIRDGWYVTGDIAQIDAEGFIRITGRASRFSKIGGEMVPHLKIEEVILQATGRDDAELRLAVSAVCDPRKGERLVVFYTDLGLPPEQICRRLIEAHLPALWVPTPDSFVQVEAIPILGSGKLDLRRLKEMAEERFGQAACAENRA